MLIDLIRLLAMVAIAAALFHAASRRYYQRRFVSHGLLPKGGIGEADYSRFLDGIDPRITTDEHKTMVRNARRCRLASMTVFAASLALVLITVMAAGMFRYL
jgi:hypothetical protein